MTKNSKIPDTHQTVMPYLVLKDSIKFIEFAQGAFGAIETHRIMRDENTVMHGEIIIGGSTIMFGDSTENVTRPASLFLYTENADETFEKALNAGATVLMELSDQSYGRSGGVTDQFGNVWWITSIQVSPV